MRKRKIDWSKPAMRNRVICRRVDPRICQRVFERVRVAINRFEFVKTAMLELEQEIGKSERQLWRYLGYWRLKALEREISLREARIWTNHKGRGLDRA